jgi:hypothetical protein
MTNDNARLRALVDERDRAEARARRTKTVADLKAVIELNNRVKAAYAAARGGTNPAPGTGFGNR